MTPDNEAREQVRSRLIKLFETDFPEVRGRIKRLENGPPISYPIQFRLRGRDRNKIREIARQVAAEMRKNPYAANVNFDWDEMSKVVKLSID